MSMNRYSWPKALKVVKNLYYTDTNTQTVCNSAIMDWSLASLGTEGGWVYSCLKKEKKKSVNGTWKCNQGDFVSSSSPSSLPLPRLLFPLNPFIVIIMCRNLCPHATPTIDRLENRRSQLGFQG